MALKAQRLPSPTHKRMSLSTCRSPRWQDEDEGYGEISRRLLEASELATTLHTLYTEVRTTGRVHVKVRLGAHDDGLCASPTP
jgi:hypothetical protein